jgi:hypothetical protein
MTRTAALKWEPGRDAPATLIAVNENGPFPGRARRPRLQVPPIALYPAVLAIALVVEMLNVSGTSPFAAVRSVIVVVVAALLVSLLGRLLLGDHERGGVLAGFWILAVLSGDDMRLAAVAAIGSVFLFGERYLLPPDRRTIRWPRVGRVFGRLAVILTIAIVIQAAQLGVLADALRSLTHETALRPGLPAPANPADPDIYMILVDGHTRPDVASAIYGRDESAFLGALTADGFTVAPRSRSNYTLTGETLSSMLNQEHLADIDRLDGLLAGTESRPEGAIVRNVINDNPTFTFLRGRGYEIDAISSGFEQVAPREADRFVDTGQINEFEIALLRRSVLSHLLEWVAPDFLSSQWRARIQGVFDQFAASPSRTGDLPRLVFAHVPSPHAPWVFHADGSPRTMANIQRFYEDTQAYLGISNQEIELAYGDQVVDTDRRLVEALDRLDTAITARGRPAVVVVFSDHGSWVYADDDNQRLRFKNLVAVRATDRELTLEPNVTLVNLLPSLFEQLYGVPWVRRADTQYRFGPRDSFDLIEVPDPDAAASP